jgi:pimeloyl-ACP methyl ester carboxylesterase
LPSEEFAREFVPSLLGTQRRQSLSPNSVRSSQSCTPPGRRALLRAGFAEHDVRDVLPQIDLPTLLLYGEEDVRSPLTVAEEMHASIPRSTPVVIPGVGHMIDIEAAERFNAEVRTFLKSVQG